MAEILLVPRNVPLYFGSGYVSHHGTHGFWRAQPVAVVVSVGVVAGALHIAEEERHCREFG